MKSGAPARMMRFIFVNAVLLTLCFTYTQTLHADTELLTANPGFENGTTGWSQDEAPTPGAAGAIFSIISPGHTGNSAAQVAIDSYTTGTDAKWAFEAVPVTAGQYYTFSDWYKADTATVLFLYYVPTGGDSANPIIEFFADASGSNLNTWVHFSKSFSATHTGTLIVAHVLQSAGTLVTDDYSLVLGTAPTLSQGHVTLSFDDGWKTYADYAFPILQSSNLKSTAYIITLANTLAPNDYMSTSTLTTLTNSGLVEIGVHTRKHVDLIKDDPVAFGYADRTAMWQAEIVDARTDLTSQGFAPADTFAYPYGSYTDGPLDVRGNVAGSAAGYIGARSVDQGYNDRNTDKYTLKQQHITNTTVFDDGVANSGTDVKDWIDYAMANDVWVILMFHDVWPSIAQCVDRENTDVADPDCTDTAVLTDIVNYLTSIETQNPGTVVTVHEGIQILGGTPPPPPTPTIAPHADVLATATSSAGAYVPYTSPTVTNGSQATATCTPVSNSLFVIGSTQVTCSATGASNTTFNVVVSPVPTVNIPPMANIGETTTFINTSIVITLSGTDADASGTLTFATTSNPTQGTLSLVSGNQVTYTPNTNFVGTDSFMFVVNDGSATSSATTTSIIVNDTVSATVPASGSRRAGGGSIKKTAGEVLGVSTGGFSEMQIRAIVALLTSFGADQAVIEKVTASLKGHPGGAVLGNSTFLFTQTLMVGSSGNEVTELQKRLATQGVYSGPITGYFGPLTKAGVVAYQTKNALPAVGIVGPLTRAKLNGK
ncbi:polysaccharide deacetylase family protein [Acetobacteraceae bacterium]|nr:polysaccharide deacetylase family protein [Candidatus Parcubacteria bacterium]